MPRSLRTRHPANCCPVVAVPRSAHLPLEHSRNTSPKLRRRRSSKMSTPMCSTVCPPLCSSPLISLRHPLCRLSRVRRSGRPRCRSAGERNPATAFRPAGLPNTCDALNDRLALTTVVMLASRRGLALGQSQARSLAASHSRSSRRELPRGQSQARSLAAFPSYVWRERP